jgi:NAD(P)-dependent dehydrogenase (short-subunit alcohol dehydrogenase family)
MDPGLANRRALVTGASKGIGLAISKVLVDEGANVVAGSRSVGDETVGNRADHTSSRETSSRKCSPRSSKSP